MKQVINSILCKRNRQAKEKERERWFLIWELWSNVFFSLYECMSNADWVWLVWRLLAGRHCCWCKTIMYMYIRCDERFIFFLTFYCVVRIHFFFVTPQFTVRSHVICSRYSQNASYWLFPTHTHTWTYHFTTHIFLTFVSLFSHTNGWIADLCVILLMVDLFVFVICIRCFEYGVILYLFHKQCHSNEPSQIICTNVFFFPLLLMMILLSGPSLYWHFKKKKFEEELIKQKKLIASRVIFVYFVFLEGLVIIEVCFSIVSCDFGFFSPFPLKI